MNFSTVVQRVQTHAGLKICPFFNRPKLDRAYDPKFYVVPKGSIYYRELLTRITSMRVAIIIASTILVGGSPSQRKWGNADQPSKGPEIARSVRVFLMKHTSSGVL